MTYNDYINATAWHEACIRGHKQEIAKLKRKLIEADKHYHLIGKLVQVTHDGGVDYWYLGKITVDKKDNIIYWFQRQKKRDGSKSWRRPCPPRNIISIIEV